MHFACSSANPMFLETVELMSARAEEEDKFALVMRQQSHNGSTPLHCLARNVAFPTSEESRFIGAVTHIVSANCISLRNRRGRTALHVAAAAGNTPAVVALQVRADEVAESPAMYAMRPDAVLAAGGGNGHERRGQGGVHAPPPVHHAQRDPGHHQGMRACASSAASPA